MTSFCTFPLSPTDRWPQDSPRPAHQQVLVWHQQVLVWHQLWRKMKKAAAGWRNRLGKQRPFQRMVMGRMLASWRTKRIPSMLPSSRGQILRQAARRGVPSQAEGVSSGRTAWKWMSSLPLSKVTLCSCLTFGLGLTPTSLVCPAPAFSSHPQVQSAIRKVRSQLAPTSTVCPHPHSAHTHKYSLSYIMSTSTVCHT